MVLFKSYFCMAVAKTSNRNDQREERFIVACGFRESFLSHPGEEGVAVARTLVYDGGSLPRVSLFMVPSKKWRVDETQRQLYPPMVHF